jgi:hypothetical protein
MSSVKFTGFLEKPEETRKAPEGALLLERMTTLICRSFSPKAYLKTIEIIA